MAVTLTDGEWLEFQSIPDQGYSHRDWVNRRIAERVEKAEGDREYWYGRWEFACEQLDEAAMHTIRMVQAEAALDRVRAVLINEDCLSDYDQYAVRIESVRAALDQNSKEN